MSTGVASTGLEHDLEDVITITTLRIVLALQPNRCYSVGDFPLDKRWFFSVQPPSLLPNTVLVLLSPPQVDLFKLHHKEQKKGI